MSELKTINTEEVVCPYCGYEYSDSWEFSDSSEIECDECGETFGFERQYYATYSSTKTAKEAQQ